MRIFPAVSLLALAACAAPEALPLAPFEESEHRFAAPPAADRRARIEAVLKKDELALEDAIAIADALNPQLEIERRNVDLATAAIWDAKLYPNPSLRLEVEEWPTSGSFVDSKRLVGVAQALPIGGRLGAATAVATKEREIAAVRYVWRRREILSAVKRAFVDVLAARQALERSEETREIARKLRDAADERFKAQAAPEMEVLKAAVSLASAESDVIGARKAHAIAVKTLHGLLGDADFPRERVAGSLVARYTVPSLEALRGQVTLSHPLLEEATKSREAAQLSLELAESERWPDVGVELAAGRGGEGDTLVEGGLEVPLPVFQRNQGRVLAAEVRLRQAELALQAVRTELVVKLVEAYRTFAAAQERVALYDDEILPKAQKALAQTEDGYKLGKFAVLDLLDAQRTLSEAKSAHVAALSDLNVAAVELEKLTGTKLEQIR